MAYHCSRYWLLIPDSLRRDWESVLISIFGFNHWVTLHSVPFTIKPPSRVDTCSKIELNQAPARPESIGLTPSIYSSISNYLFPLRSFVDLQVSKYIWRILVVFTEMLWIVRILVHNGIAIVTTWLTCAWKINLATVIAYTNDRSSDKVPAELRGRPIFRSKLIYFSWLERRCDGQIATERHRARRNSCRIYFKNVSH